MPPNRRGPSPERVAAAWSAYNAAAADMQRAYGVSEEAWWDAEVAAHRALADYVDLAREQEFSPEDLQERDVDPSTDDAAPAQTPNFASESAQPWEAADRRGVAADIAPGGHEQETLGQFPWTEDRPPGERTWPEPTPTEPGSPTDPASRWQAYDLAVREMQQAYWDSDAAFDSAAQRAEQIRREWIEESQRESTASQAGLPENTHEGPEPAAEHSPAADTAPVASEHQLPLEEQGQAPIASEVSEPAVFEHAPDGPVVLEAVEPHPDAHNEAARENVAAVPAQESSIPGQLTPSPDRHVEEPAVEEVGPPAHEHMDPLLVQHEAVAADAAQEALSEPPEPTVKQVAEPVAEQPEVLTPEEMTLDTSEQVQTEDLQMALEQEQAMERAGGE